jgi:hypothetical protein
MVRSGCAVLREAFAVGGEMSSSLNVEPAYGANCAK